MNKAHEHEPLVADPPEEIDFPPSANFAPGATWSLWSRIEVAAPEERTLAQLVSDRSPAFTAFTFTAFTLTAFLLMSFTFTTFRPTEWM